MRSVQGCGATAIIRVSVRSQQRQSDSVGGNCLPLRMKNGLDCTDPGQLQSFIHDRTLLPRHHSLSSTGRKCHLCVRYNVLPMSQAAKLLNHEALRLWRGLFFLFIPCSSVQNSPKIVGHAALVCRDCEIFLRARDK